MTKAWPLREPEEVRFTPIAVATDHLTHPTRPEAYDCIRFLIIVRGTATITLDDERHWFVKPGDVAALAAHAVTWIEPQDCVTVATMYLDQDYAIDQVFWRYAAHFTHRYDAVYFFNASYADAAQVTRIGESRVRQVLPWLMELEGLTAGDAPSPDRFYRLQSLLAAVLDVIVPRLDVTPPQFTPATASLTLSAPRHRLFRPLRPEALAVATMLRNDLSRRWTVTELAEAVHLSPVQLRRIVQRTFGKTPIAYLTMLRAEKMAELLRTSNLTISMIAELVGWGGPDFAARQFRRIAGIPPSVFREMSRYRLADDSERNDREAV